MSLCKAVGILFVATGLTLHLFGCAPRPASEEGGDDAMVTVTKEDPAETAPEAKATLEASSPQSRDPKNILPFSHPGKMTESDIERILAEKSPEEATLINPRFVSIALLLFDVIYDRYPTEEEGLAILLDPPITPEGEQRDPIAREILLKDGWGNPIQYRLTTWGNDLPGFDVWSYGPDGDGSDDDIQPDFMDEIVKTAAMIEAGALDDMRSATGEVQMDE